MAAPPKRKHLIPGAGTYVPRRNSHGFTPAEYVAYWKAFDSPEYPASIRKALNLYDLPTFWEDIYELSVQAYGDDRAIDQCLEILADYTHKHPSRMFGHSTKRCTQLTRTLIYKMGNIIRNRPGGSQWI